jgi:hypothetical protein
MTMRFRSAICVNTSQPWHPRTVFVAAVVAIGSLSACSSSTSTSTDAKPKDSSVIDSSPKKDSTSEAGPIVCSANGQTYSVGQTVVLAGDCPITCVCQSTGSLGQCTGGCNPDGGPDAPGPDGPPPTDAGFVCSRGGQTYLPGEAVPANDGCGGSCICQADGTIGHCTGACPPDAGPDAPIDRAGVDAQIDGTPLPIDTACAGNAPCSLANGAKGLCVANTCKACSGAQADSSCVAVYGAGTICADGQCVTGTCHDSTVCTGNKVCDSTHSCHNCASDLQCQNDAVYGKGTICLANGQCGPGVCHTSSDCQGKKLCDSAAHTCSACTTDVQCQADTVYGTKSICVSSQCVAGTCASTTDCKSAGRLCPSATKICTACATDSQCQGDAAYGAGNICVEGQCVSGTCTDSSGCPNGRVCNTTSHACVACANDTQCKNDSKYGQHTLCLSGACTTGDCHDISSDCSAGRLCGSTVPHACGDCTTDTQCKQDARYGSTYLCVGNLCVKGNCHDTSNDCTAANAGLVCGATTAHTCGACTIDDQCKNDPKYGANTICNTAGGADVRGECVTSACTNTGHACAANNSDVCCSSKCISGNCCVDNDCVTNPSYGDGFFCRQNTCTRCDNVTGNAYLVDPVGGDDGTATGSGTSGTTTTASCAFRTVTRALQVIGTPSGATTITIVGRTGTTNLFTVAPTGDTSPVEALPIQLPANVTLKSKTGPIKLTLLNGKVGFNLLGDKASIQPDAAAALTIDGANQVSGAGIVVTAGTGTATISNVTITNPGDDGIQVTSGTLRILGGVHVTGAGTPGSRQSGLTISDGTVNIVPGTDPATSFESNTQSGIAVSATGVLNITGTTSAGGTHSVVVQNNFASNVDFGQNPGAVSAVSTIDGLYSVQSTTGDGLRINAGTKIKVRNSIFQANSGNGIRIASAGAAVAANALDGIDLGQTGSANAGHNVLQVPTQVGSNPNSGAGLCVDLAADAGTPTLMAVGNLFAGHDCSTSNGGAIQKSPTCTGATDLGVIQASGTTVTVNVSSCTP